MFVFQDGIQEHEKIRIELKEAAVKEKEQELQELHKDLQEQSKEVLQMKQEVKKVQMFHYVMKSLEGCYKLLNVDIQISKGGQ